MKRFMMGTWMALVSVVALCGLALALANYHNIEVMDNALRETFRQIDLAFGAILQMIKSGGTGI